MSWLHKIVPRKVPSGGHILNYLVGVFVIASGGLTVLGPTLFAVGMAALSVATLGYCYPSFAFSCWLICLCAVPYWAGIYLGGYIPPTTIAILVLLTPLAVKAVPRWSFFDSVIVLLGLLVVLATLVSSVRTQDIYIFLFQWLAAYVFGRFVAYCIPEESYSRLLVFATTLAALGGIWEFVRGSNPYANWYAGNELYRIWSPEQTRGSVIRIEWAFGHSIALGLTLGMALVLAILARMPAGIKAALVAVIAVAGVLTFSRSAIFTLTFGTILALIATPRDRIGAWTRVLIVVALTVLTTLGYSFVADVFDDAREETARSGDFRLTLFSFLGRMLPLGGDPSTSNSSQGLSIGQYTSIDNAFVYAGLTYGYLFAAILLILIVLLAYRGLRARSPIGLAVVATSPALFSVALVTQFSALYFLSIGLLVSELQTRPGVRVGPSQQEMKGSDLRDETASIRTREIKASAYLGLKGIRS